MMAENEPRTIGYLRVSRESQDPEKNRADILTLANREDPKERNPETQGMKSYGGIGTYVRLGPLSGVPSRPHRRPAGGIAWMRRTIGGKPPFAPSSPGALP